MLIGAEELHDRCGIKSRKAEAAAWLSGLFVGSDEAVTWQTFDDKGERPELARIIHATLDDAWVQLRKLNRQGAGVFVMVNAGDGRGRKASNVVSVRALFVDIDREPPAAWHLEPSMLVASGRGVHAYWAVHDGQVAAFKQHQLRLIARYSSDRAVHDLPRVMRVAGFDHCKGRPTRVRLAALSSWGMSSVAEAVARLPDPHKREQYQRAKRKAAHRRKVERGERDGRGFGDLDIAAAFGDRGGLGRSLGKGKWSVCCPWIGSHTVAKDPATASDTVVFEASGGQWPQFHCAHSSCAGLGIVDVLREWGML